MKSVLTVLLAAAAASIVASPALAKASEKGADARPTARQNEIPPGILKAMQRAFPQVGHGNDVPRGNGHGWGHSLHDHEESPVSP